MLLQYAARRLLAAIPVLLVATILIFAMVHLLPGDPIKAMFRQEPGAGGGIPPAVYQSLKEKHGFDKPLHQQYLVYMRDLFHGDMGQSLIFSKPVTQLIKEKAPFSFRLAVAAIIFALLIGVPLGIIAAMQFGKWGDTASMIIAIFGVSMPNFWFGLMAMLIFAVQLPWFPPSGAGTLSQLILPAITLGTAAAAIIARLTRSSLLEVLGEDYINAARAKGLRESSVVIVHGLRNALIPVVTMVGLQIGSLLTGTVVVETVFARPGLGSLMLTAVKSKDLPLVQGLILVIAATYVMVNIAVDVLYAVLDPRIEY